MSGKAGNNDITQVMDMHYPATMPELHIDIEIYQTRNAIKFSNNKCQQVGGHDGCGRKDNLDHGIGQRCALRYLHMRALWYE